jgi:hypothetical protein
MITVCGLDLSGSQAGCCEHGLDNRRGNLCSFSGKSVLVCFGSSQPLQKPVCRNVGLKIVKK